MKIDQFSITGILLNEDQAEQLKIDCINTIENYGIENLRKRQEIEVDYDYNDPVKVSIDCKITAIYKDSVIDPFSATDPEKIERQSVDFLSIKLWNEQGDPIRLKVSESDEFLANNYLTIEERIKSHFTI